MIPGRNTQHPSFLESFGFAARGIWKALKSERNLKVMTGASILAIVLGIGLKVPLNQFLAVIMLCGLVLAGEMLNTAIECLVDLVTKEFEPLAGKVKDIAAGAVLILSITAFVVGILIYGSAILKVI